MRIDFRALGTLELRGQDGQRIDALLSQPKRIALLAYLAAAAPRGLHSRDRLVALFSPEQDQARARQALRQALSVLRKALGPDAIVTVGDEEVGLNFAAVSCDIVAFDDAVTAGRHADALEFYRGGFLEAFFVPDSPDFEKWLESEQARRQRDASACAKALMDRCEAAEDLAAAVIWARRARQLAPDDEVLLRRLMQLLDRSGDRARALSAYDEFADWLKREFEAEPAPETQRLVKTIRERHTAVGPVEQPTIRRAPEPAPPPTSRPPPRRSWAPVVLSAGALVLVGGLVVYWLWPWRDRPSCVQIERLQVESVTLSELADSLEQRVAQQLTGFPDFVTRPPGDRCPRASSVVRQVTGALRIDLGLHVEARLSGEPSVSARGAQQDWRLLGDSVANQLLVQILRSPLDSSLPFGVLPRTPAGMKMFLAAERLFAEGRWEQAGEAYVNAEAMDSTCYLCSWRAAEVGRWLRADPDPDRPPSYLDHVHLFPARYQNLIRATHAPLRVRFDTLTAATRNWPHFFLGWFKLGDELFHRGSLVGRARSEAIDALRATVNQRPDFAPAWEHLAWALALEGDSAGAYKALDKVMRLRHADDRYSLAIDAMVNVGIAWRFAARADAMSLTTRSVSDRAFINLPELAAGPRYVPTFGAPRGAVEFGRYFAQPEARADLVPSALIAQLFGYIALGQPDSARAVVRELASRALTPELALLVHELDAALLLLDADVDAVRHEWPALAKQLSHFAETRNASAAVHRRAAWTFIFLARRAGETSERYAALLEQEPPPQPLRRLVVADSLARSGRLKQALAASDTLTELTASGLATHEPLAPFFRAVLHLLRADWYLQLGDLQDSRAELMWYQNLDDHGWLLRDPQMAEADWALGTLAQWRLARQLDRAGEQRSAACRAYTEVIRLWSGGAVMYSARADTARGRRVALGCA